MALYNTDGAIYVAGAASIDVPFRYKLKSVSCHFLDPDPPPPGCGPYVPDSCSISIVDIGRPYRPRWAMRIVWNVTNAPYRVLGWEAEYVRKK